MRNVVYFRGSIFFKNKAKTLLKNCEITIYFSLVVLKKKKKIILIIIIIKN